MAIISCKECGKDISDEAKTCPNCGITPKKKGIGCGTLIVAVILIMVIAGVFGKNDPLPSGNVRTMAEVTAEKSVANLTAKGKNIKSKHPAWPDDICNTIADRQVYAGMTTEQAQAAWGKPYKINYTTYSNNREREQWVMHERGSSYLYFENGILTTIQGSK
jgi:hypothetical protein